MKPPEDHSRIQAQVLKFLGDPATHGAAVRRIDTHASVVFLAGRRAFKVKRAIRLPFLDYSTLEKRKAACDAELNINKQNAPEIYRQVLPIVRDDAGRLAVGGAGTPVEWVLEMVRFDEERTLDTIARTGVVGSHLATQIADAIVQSHNAAAPAPARWIESIPTIIGRNTAKFRSQTSLNSEEINRLDDLSRAAFAHIRMKLEERTARGTVRRCHGDLHLANIALIDDKPVLFDAIEFDPALATTDVLYDVAFTIMDFIHFKQNTAANIVFNRYLAATEEQNLDGLCALPLFMSMRAAIRAHVLFTRHEQGRDAPTLEKAQSYFALASELIEPATPRLITIGGTSGTGKSVLSRALASEIMPRPGAVIVRSDAVRKKMSGVTETSRLPDSAYRPSASVDVYRTLTELASKILRQGCSVIVDAAFLRESERKAIRKVACERDLSFAGLFLHADLATRLQRISARTDDISDATEEVARLQEHYDLGALDGWITVDAAGTPQQTLKCARAALSSGRA